MHTKKYQATGYLQLYAFIDSRGLSSCNAFALKILLWILCSYIDEGNCSFQGISGGSVIFIYAGHLRYSLFVTLTKPMDCAFGLYNIRHHTALSMFTHHFILPYSGWIYALDINLFNAVMGFYPTSYLNVGNE